MTEESLVVAGGGLGPIQDSCLYGLVIYKYYVSGNAGCLGSVPCDCSIMGAGLPLHSRLLHIHKCGYGGYL